MTFGRRASPPEPRPSRWSGTLPSWAAGAVIAVMAVLAYAPAFDAEYVQDDHVLVESGPVVERGSLREIVGSSYWAGTASDDQRLYRPVTVLTWAVERRFLGRPDAGVSHAVNVAIHALTSLLLAAWTRRLGAGGAAAALAGALFALHPVHAEAVANVVGRSELLAALFVLASLLLQTHSGPWQPSGGPPPGAARARLAAWGSAACFFFALGSKETALAALPLLVVQEILFRPPERRLLARWLVERGAALAPAALALLLFAILRVQALEAILAGTIPPVDNPLVEMAGGPRLATALALLARTMRLMLLPVRLAADYSGSAIALESGILSPLPLAGLVCLAGWAVLAGMPFLSRRRSLLVRQLSAAAWLFLLPYLVIGNLIVPIGAIFAERFLYLPSAGYCLLLGAVAGQLGEGRLAGIAGSPMQIRRHVVTAVTLFLCGFAILTLLRASEWQSDETIFEATSRVNPGSPRAHYIVGTLLARRGETRAALARIERALSAWHEYPRGWEEKGVLLAQLGDLEGAEAAFREALRIEPQHAASLMNLGLSLRRQGRVEEAQRALRKAILADPGSDKAWAELGNIAFDDGRYGAAVAAYRRAMALGRSDLAPRLREALKGAASGGR